jgi:hypothetical protein
MRAAVGKASGRARRSSAGGEKHGELRLERARFRRCRSPEPADVPSTQDELAGGEAIAHNAPVGE